LHPQHRRQERDQLKKPAPPPQMDLYGQQTVAYCGKSMNLSAVIV
jgi:hypothetical protein